MVEKLKTLRMLPLLALAFIVALAGCASGGKTASSGGNSSNEENVELTLAMMFSTNSDDIKLVEGEINKITKEKINATVNLLPIGGAAWQQQTNLMMTGNEKLDLLVTFGGMGYGTQAVKGQIIPLDDLLVSHGQGILDVVPEHMLEATKIKGITYGVPSIKDWATDYGFLMRKDLVEKYNIDLSQVETFEDLGPVFQTIKENEPSMNVIANTKLVTPAGRISDHYFDTLGDALGVVAMNGDGNVENMFENPDYKGSIELVREWFQAGYIIKDAATSDETMENIVKAGKGFGFFSHMKPGYESQQSRLTGYEMVAVRLADAILPTTRATSMMMSIPRNSKYPEKAMELMNLLYTDADIMNLIANGIEGKHYIVKDEGVIAKPEGLIESGYTFGAWQIGNNFLTSPWEENGPDYWEQMKEHNENATLSPVFGFNFDPDPVKTEIAAATNVLNQYRAGLETGTLDPEKSLQEFNGKLKASGLDKIIAEKQKQLDEWRSKK
ncbi:ABC transporter substrate-binding protein [Bacillus sp. FJAT-50079]|uniref:ABC transporter substrate-binding protein n=1 Tax=Bacillus sp. FJAT-50079 TaxID=2833577 RepID=UPI001BCA393D|nr:ABC transporter substrate-binding protein [Bacillus sp. FJAT-50079]MBS4207998.1 ABC transporter substrate-binding protein [Bacillus sp. FJAT-50079]